MAVDDEECEIGDNVGGDVRTPVREEAEVAVCDEGEVVGRGGGEQRRREEKGR